MSTRFALLVLLLATGLLSACGSSTTAPASAEPFVVNSLADLLDPPDAVTTLRSALEAAPSGQVITFDPALDGGTIDLTLVAAEHSVLEGEVMGIRDEPSGPVSYLVGYFERDYGRSALYSDRDVVIDASALPLGITLAWAGVEDDDARVLAVYGDLVMRNVTVSGGRATTVPLVPEEGDEHPQPWTLARGAGVAVWGTARLEDCTLYDNHCVGDFESSRDRGAFGGGIYANIVEMEDCKVCGNTVLGGGAAGGGVFSVGGAAGSVEDVSTLRRCAVTGNRISALFTYGGGVYSDGGGIGERNVLALENCTVARNVVEPAPGMPPFLLAMGYWRGGGVYMSNGYATLTGCTVVENEVYGYPRQDSLERANLAGGVAATVGNAHAVEELILKHSIIAGNVVHELGFDGLVASTYDHDVFSGSLLYFRSRGYNRLGVLDFRQILVPVGERNWKSLCRKHYPKQGDADGVAVADVLDLEGGVTTSAWMLSAGVAPGTPAVLRYEPAGTALDQIPAAPYSVFETFAEYRVASGGTDNFLSIFLTRLESAYGPPGFAGAFQLAFETFLQTVDLDAETAGLQPYTDPTGASVLTLADTHWYGPAETWPKEVVNYPWIEFWHQLDAALAAEAIPALGVELLNDDAWMALFESGGLIENPFITMLVENTDRGETSVLDDDQRGAPRPANEAADIGAIEVP